MTAAIVVVIPTALIAQSSDRTRDRDPDVAAAKRVASELQKANFHFGPFYLLSRIRLADAGFTDEFYVPTEDQTGGVSLTVEAPQRLYMVPARKVILTAEATPGYSFFSRGDEHGQFNWAARADAHFLFNHLYADVYTSHSNALRGRVADINRLLTLRDKESGIAGEMKYSSRTSVLFSGRYRDVSAPPDRYQPDPVKVPVNLLDRVERNGRVALHHKTFPLTSLFVATEASDYSFRRATYKDGKRAYVGAGFNRVAGRSNLRVEAGPVRLNFADPSQRDYSGIIGEASLTRTAGRWVYGGGVDRDLGFSILLNNNYYVYTLGRVNASYSATRRLTLRAGSTFERDVYEVPVNGHRRTDTVSFSTAGFIYAFRHVSAGIDGGWYQRTTTFGGDEGHGIRWVLNLSFTP